MFFFSFLFSIFGLMIIFVEFRVPMFITMYAGFLCSFMGRGLWYLL